MSNNPLTVAYLTARRDPQFQWFAQSLAREVAGSWAGLRILVIDFYADGHARGDDWSGETAALRIVHHRKTLTDAGCPVEAIFISPPMWSVWQGPHRLTKENWFAKADYLNAAVCLTDTSHLACVDDLSVLRPGWLTAARQAVDFAGVTCGAYQKVRGLEVKDGEIVHFRDFLPGVDSRWKRGSDKGPVPCEAGLMYGCSFVVPVEAAIRVNGWPHYSNGMGYEDCVTGTMMGKHGFPFRYDRRMLTFESDEHHFIGKQMRRDDPGQSPHDKSHVLKRMGEELMSFPQHWPEGENLMSIRTRVLADPLRELPVIRHPIKEPFSGRALAELGEQLPPQPIKFVAPVAHNLPKISMPEAVQAEIVKAHALLQGWCPMDKALLLCAEIAEMKPELVVDIGTFGGKSTIPMAIQLRANGKGLLMAIDPWDNEAACEGYGGNNLVYWKAMDFPKIKQAFHLHRQRMKLESIIAVSERKSDDVILLSEPSIDLLHIDGQKDETVIRDVNRFASKVRVGGMCCLNDLDWEGGFVQQAASRLLELGFVQSYRIGTGAMYRRTHLPT